MARRGDRFGHHHLGDVRPVVSVDFRVRPVSGSVCGVTRPESHAVGHHGGSGRAILNLSVWFTLHTLFGTVTELHPLAWQQIRVWSPEWTTLDWRALVIAAASILALFRFHLGMLPTLGGAALLGLVFRFVI